MGKTLEMQFIQYMNFFEKLIGMRTKHCFSFNNTIFFVVNPNLVSRAVGENASNIRELTERLRRRVRIIAAPSSTKDAEKFVCSLIYPIKIKRFIAEGEEASIIAPREARAMIIGRNKVKLAELENILKEYFGIKRLKLI